MFDTAMRRHDGRSLESHRIPAYLGAARRGVVDIDCVFELDHDKIHRLWTTSVFEPPVSA